MICCLINSRFDVLIERKWSSGFLAFSSAFVQFVLCMILKQFNHNVGKGCEGVGKADNSKIWI